MAQVRFTEWTDDGRLRHPAYLGLRDDVDPTAVRREAENTLIAQAHARLRPAAGLTTNAASNAGANTSATNPTRSVTVRLELAVEENTSVRDLHWAFA